MFQVHTCLKTWEEDTFENGYIPNTGGLTEINARHIQANTVTELIQMINDFAENNDPDALTLGACAEPDRIDVQVMETEDGVSASDADLDAWQRGERRLWLACYSFYVVETKPASLMEAA